MMKDETKKFIRQLGVASTLGLQVAMSVFVGLAIGVYLDYKFKTQPWLSLAFMILGVVAGFLNYYRFVRKQQKNQ